MMKVAEWGSSSHEKVGLGLKSKELERGVKLTREFSERYSE